MINKLQKTLSVILVLLSLQAIAQKGVIKGRIFDISSNEGIPFANIIISGTNIGTTSDIDGKYEFTGLEPGIVKIEVSVIGYTRKQSAGIQVTNAKATYMDLGLSPSSQQLEEVVIESSPFERPEESPVSMRTIGINEIERAAGANRDISKVIQSFPGVTSSPAFRNDIIIRGGSPNENRFYLDGVEVPNINHFATQGASGGPVGIINTNFIKEVEFYSGAFPANRGNALSSVLEFSQIDGNPDKINTRLTLGASDMGLTLDGPLGEKTTYIFSVRQSYLQFLFDVIGLPFLPTFNDYQFKSKTKFDKKNELTVVSLGALDRFKLNKDANEEPFQRYILNNIPVQNQWNYTIGGVYKHFMEKSFQTYVLSRNMLNNESYKYENNDESSEDNLLLRYNSQEIENKFRFENTYRNNSSKINFGLNLENAKYNNSTFNRFANPNAPDGVDTAAFSSEALFYKYGLFGQASRKFLENRLTLSLGLRMDGINYNSVMANPLQQLAPRFSASYALTDKWSVNANTGRYYQLPPYTILGYKENGALVNQGGLKYIRADHVVAGFEWLPKKYTRITLEGFYKNYDNYPSSINRGISLANLGGDFGVVGNEAVSSNSEGRAYGAELFIQQKAVKGFYGILSLTWVRSEFKLYSDANYIPSSWDSEYLVTATLGKKFKNGWEIGARWRYVNGRPYTPVLLPYSSFRRVYDVTGAGVPDYTNLNSERLPAFHQLDLRVDKKWFFEKWSLNLYFDVQNAYNFQSDGPPLLFVKEDANLDPIIENPQAPYDQQVYDTQLTANPEGTVLPTLGIILEF